MQRPLGLVTLLLFSAVMLVACGGGGPARPTAIPASVARPDQPTPVYAQSKPVFAVTNAAPTVIIEIATSEAITELTEIGDALEPVALTFQLPPSAMGIAPGGATVFDEPNGDEVASVPAGGLLTVTGRSADGDWLAVYNEVAVAGWVPASRLRLYGADDLTIVTEAISPGPIATLIADAMLPPATSALDAVMTTIAQTPQATITPP